MKNENEIYTKIEFKLRKRQRNQLRFYLHYSARGCEGYAEAKGKNMGIFTKNPRQLTFHQKESETVPNRQMSH